MPNDYFELLKHPEWQKKRLKVMERDGFRCETCQAADRTLNVHHTYYTKGARPREYPDDSLVSLCERCHQKRQAIETELKRAVGLLPQIMLELVLGYSKGLALKHSKNPNASIHVEYGSHEVVGLADAAFGNKRVSEIITPLQEGHGELDRATYMALIESPSVASATAEG